MKRCLSAAALAVLACLPLPAVAQEAFHFMAIGDMPYYIPKDYEKLDRLIDKINKEGNPAFTIHVGDIKSGSTHCSDEIFQKVLERFNSFEAPLLYTPGDNEWTDCHRQNNGSYDPIERLAKVRTMFFPDPSKSLGKTKLDVESQSVVMREKFGAYVENTRFVKNGVLFVTAHVVGSNNNLEPRDRKAVLEYFDRNEANVAWLDAAFAKAKTEKLKAVVVMAQADLYDIRQQYPAVPSASGHIDTIKAFERGAKTFGGPILYIHGDEHRFVIDRMVGTNLKPIPNTIRLQVYGANQVHGVIVRVEPNTPGVFGFTPFIVPENGDH